MPPQLVSLNPKPPAKQTPAETLQEYPGTPTYPDKTTSSILLREDALPAKRKVGPESGDDDRNTEPTPRHNRRVSTDTRRTPRGYSALHTTGRTRLPRISRAFESKFHALERRQKNLIQQTRLEGQLEYLTVSKSCSEKFWITVEGNGKPFIRIPFESPVYYFE